MTTIKSWTNEITNPSEEMVFKALANPKWDFRTVNGIAKETNLDNEQVAKIIDVYNGKLIRKSLVPSVTGEQLYTLKSKKANLAEIYDQFRALLSKNI